MENFEKIPLYFLAQFGELSYFCICAEMFIPK